MEFIKVFDYYSEEMFIRVSDVKRFYEYDCQPDDVEDDLGCYELIFELEGQEHTYKKYFKTVKQRDSFIAELEQI